MMARTTDEKIQIAYDALYKYDNINDVCIKYDCDQSTIKNYINEFSNAVTSMRMSEIGKSKIQKISKEKKNEMYRMYEEGYQYSDIAEALGFKRKTVYNTILEYRHMKETVKEKKTICSDDRSKIMEAIEDCLYQVFDLFDTLKNYEPQEEK